MKKSFFIFLVTLLHSSLLFSQVSVNSTGNPADNSAMLDVSSTTRGFLIPRMTSAEMNAILNPAEGLVVYNLTIHKPVFFDGNLWKSFDGQWYCGIPIIDNRNGQVYNTIQIGTQCWMAENLNVGTRIDGAINQLNNGIIEKYCYDDSDANCNTYGGLYQWNEMMQHTTTPGVQGVCPTGWHLPTDEEWTALTDYVSSIPDFQCNSNPTFIAKSLAATTLWNTSTNTCAVGNNLAENNATGFSSLPSGCYDNSLGAFTNVGYYCHWWTSTESSRDFPGQRNLKWKRGLGYLWWEHEREAEGEAQALSVRCISDN